MGPRVSRAEHTWIELKLHACSCARDPTSDTIAACVHLLHQGMGRVLVRINIEGRDRCRGATVSHLHHDHSVSIAMATGDLDGDGYADIAAGASGYDDGITNAGM